MRFRNKHRFTEKPLYRNKLAVITADWGSYGSGKRESGAAHGVHRG